MKRPIAVILGVVLAGLWPSAAGGQCPAPISIAVVTTGSHTQQCVPDPVTGRWNVTVTLNGPVTSNSTITIRGASNLMLGRVTIQNNTAIDCRVNILGSGFDQRIGGVGCISRGTSGADRVLLLGLSTTGSVGYDRPPGGAAIMADMIYNLSIGGSVEGDMVSVGPMRTMGNIFIQGDLAGGISLGPVSSLLSLWVGGAVGRPAEPPVALNISGNIGGITAGSINADINALVNGAAGTVHLIETTAGPFRGSLTCHRLGMVAGAAGNPRLAVMGDLDADIIITRDIRHPVAIAGGFAAGRTISAGTGAFDDPAADPGATVAINGDFAGGLVLGTPLAAGLGSLNRPLLIGGAMTGSITAANDLAAGITVGGPVSGSVTTEGGLRAGQTVSMTGPLMPSGVVSIGGSLMGTVAVPADGLRGQVVVNARNVGGSWSGAVTVGGSNVFVSVPNYTVASAAVGGGSVGVAPFGAHLSDCFPAHNTPGPGGFVEPGAFTDPVEPAVKVRLYGPVQPAAGISIGEAVVVERSLGAGWVNWSSWFNVGFSPAGASGRVVTLRGSGVGVIEVGRYRVRPLALGCAGVSGSPAAAWTTPYVFRIEEDCDGDGLGDSEEIAANPGLDQNGDGVLDACGGPPPPGCACDHNDSGELSVQDLFDFLGDFFAGNSAADFNSSGGLSVQDLFDFLGCYFNRPPGC